jgi:hypothetical protein
MKICLLCGSSYEPKDDVMFASERSISGLMRFLGVLTEDEMERFAKGLFNMQVVTDVEFQRRFPARHAKWKADIEGLPS